MKNRLLPLLAISATLAAATPVVRAQTNTFAVSIFPAVEVQLPTEVGTIYRLQGSTNFTNWFDIGPAFAGSGSNLSQLISTLAQPAQFFRAASQSAPVAGLVAYYPLDGDTLDYSGNGNHGVSVGATVGTNRFGQTNAAFLFDGSGAHVAVSNSPSLQPTNAVTVAAWVNFEEGGNFSPRVVYKQSYQLATDGTGANRPVSFFVPSGNPASGSLAAGAWHFLTGTYDGATVKIYVNGVLSASTPGSGEIPTNSTPLNLGRNSDNGLDVYKGLIDEVRIYNRALDSNEVQVLYLLPK